jgi:uncharacterized protein YceK
MKIVMLLALVSLLSGCTAVLNALGLGVTDVAPSLRYCDEVKYERNQTQLIITAKCKVPAGGG